MTSSLLVDRRSPTIEKIIQTVKQTGSPPADCGINNKAFRVALAHAIVLEINDIMAKSAKAEEHEVVSDLATEARRLTDFLEGLRKPGVYVRQ